MINILGRYIAKAIITATGLVALIITGVLFLMIMLKELKSIGEGDYNISEAILFVLMQLPNELYQFSPLLILLGSIIGLSLLSSHRELAVMRASGFSIRRIIFNVLSSALMLILAISLVGEWMGPSLSYKAEVQKENAQNAGQAVVTSAGVWFHIDDNFIHVQQVVDRTLLEGVTRYQFDAHHHLLATYYAKTLTLQNHQWLMHDVVKTTFHKERTKSQSFTQIPWNLKMNLNLLNAGFDPSDMPLPKLIKFIHYLEKNQLQASEYQYNLWQRLFKPLASLVMIFLAIPFVLGAFSTITLGRRILIGVMMGFMFFILNSLLGQLCIVYQLPALFAALFPPLLFFLIGVFLSKSIVRF